MSEIVAVPGRTDAWCVGETEFVRSFGLDSTPQRFRIRKNASLMTLYQELCPRVRGGRIVELGIADGGSTALLALAAQPTLPVAIAALVLAGFAAGPINPLLFTVQTEIVPAELRGRVFGAIRAGAWAAIPLGILLGGLLVSAIGAPATFLVMGVLLATVVGYGFLNPAFREMDASVRDEAREQALAPEV